MDLKTLINFFSDPKIQITSMISILLFMAVGLYLLHEPEEWKGKELNQQNFFLSIRIPSDSRNVSFSPTAKRGLPSISSVFESSELVFEDVERQLLSQGWNKEEKYTSKNGDNAQHEYRYRKGQYLYSVIKYNEKRWYEGISSDNK